MIEENIFLKSEADQWYKRNAHALSPEARKGEFVDAFLRQQKIKFKRVLEVGSANGWRLEAMRAQWPRAKFVGVEPSQKAIAEGKKKFPKLTLVRGVASKLPVKGVFDLVIVAFVFHWVSREQLLASVAEIDRHTAEGGYLLVSDFLPKHPRRNDYRHRKGVSTWKMDYGALFEASGNYILLNRSLHDYRTGKYSTARTPENMRMVASLYQKKTGIGYK